MNDFPLASIFELIIYSLASAVIAIQSYGYDVFDLGIVRDKSLVKVMRFPMLHDKIWVYATKTYLQL